MQANEPYVCFFCANINIIICLLFLKPIGLYCFTADYFECRFAVIDINEFDFALKKTTQFVQKIYS